jgi:hypothetical protein
MTTLFIYFFVLATAKDQQKFTLMSLGWPLINSDSRHCNIGTRQRAFVAKMLNSHMRV